MLRSLAYRPRFLERVRQSKVKPMEVVRIVSEARLRCWHELWLVEVKNWIDQAAGESDVWEEEERVTDVEL